MGDRRSLGIIGCILSGLTAVVMGAGLFVIQGHLTGRYVLEESPPVAEQSQAVRIAAP